MNFKFQILYVCIYAVTDMNIVQFCSGNIGASNISRFEIQDSLESRGRVLKLVEVWYDVPGNDDVISDLRRIRDHL